MVTESRPVSVQRLRREGGKRKERWVGRGHRGAFRDDGCYLDFGNGFTGVHKPMFIKLFSLNTRSLLCVNYNPIKLLQKKKRSNLGKQITSQKADCKLPLEL